MKAKAREQADRPSTAPVSLQIMSAAVRCEQFVLQGANVSSNVPNSFTLVPQRPWPPSLNEHIQPPNPNPTFFTVIASSTSHTMTLCTVQAVQHKYLLL